MTPDRDPRLDLPGATRPPLEGRRWAWVKIAAWAGAVAVVLCVAAVVARLVSALTP